MNTLADIIGVAEVKFATCQKHGLYEQTRLIGQVWSRCPDCQADEDEAEESRKRMQIETARLAAWQRRLESSGIPPRFHDRTLESYAYQDCDGKRAAWLFARGYADRFSDVCVTGQSAVFCGRPGTGKTHLACGIALKVMRDNKTVLFTSVMRAIRQVKDSWRASDSRAEGAVISLFTAPDLLILDEVGIQGGTEFERHLLFDVINERYEHRRPTLLLSNLDRAGVSEYLGERIIDRIREDGGQVVVFGWKSHRGGGYG